MTCIVGIEYPGGVIIGGDSAGLSGWSKTIRADEKVFTNGPYVMGFTSSFRMGQLLRYRLTVPEPDIDDLDRFMVTTFVDAVRTTLKDGGYAKIENTREEGGTFLVGVGGRLFQVHSDFQVGRAAQGYSACGCGNDIALGSLHTTDRYDIAPADRVRHALDAACALSGGVAGPYTVIDRPLAGR
ncbi:hypothetical protein H7J86_24405 [Mycobacterium hackensackense]|uniref:hypothetical protein n=1 Tax=Mycobacterium hackensackense TaxID=228909 RepID=UPI002265E1A1|nr:hypothetical protein [Mycobacterium hackensackense]MCV7255310.1 hypothetical protein [Mycobacterium hackensackense]